MKFASPWFLLFLLLPIAYLFFKYRGPVSAKNLLLSPTLLFSSSDLFSKKNTVLARLYHPITDGFFCAALVFLTIALARPLGGHSINTDKYYGIDIVLAIDTSGSMLDADVIPSNMPYRNVMGQRVYFDPQHTLTKLNRLSSAKRVITDYIDKQTFNRIGVVLFAGYSYTLCPLTLDKNMFRKPA
jgi:Ca-activated chloride channel homolog